MRINLRAILSQRRFRSSVALAVIVLLVVLGVRLLSLGHAATGSISLEAENGSTSGNAVSANDASASNGKAVSFNAAASQYTVNADFSPKNGAWFGAAEKNYLSHPDTQPHYTEDVPAREQQLGRKYDIVLTYRFLGNTTMASLAEEQWLLETNKNPMVMVSWPNDSNIPTLIPDIASGKDDAQIKAFAGNLKALNGHILLRPTWEFNHSGFKTYAVNWYGGDYGTYITAWKRMWTIFFGDAAAWQSMGISGTPVSVDNVKFVWCPGAYGTADGDYRPYYPGDKYVDWIGIDTYPQSSLIPVLDMVSLQPQIINWYATYAGKGKPMMIGETGVQRVDSYGAQTLTNRAAWYDASFTQMTGQMPQLKAFNYFDSLNAKLVGLNKNYRIDAPGPANDTGASALAAYKAMANQPYFNQPTTFPPRQ